MVILGLVFAVREASRGGLPAMLPPWLRWNREREPGWRTGGCHDGRGSYWGIVAWRRGA